MSKATRRADRIYGGVIHQNDASFKSLANSYGPGGGGITNGMSGMGGATDKTTGSFYTPRIFNSSQELQVIYAQSWAARKFIDIPVDDQFALPRTFKDGDPELIKKIKAFEDSHNISNKIKDAQKAGRLYGTALLWFVTAEESAQLPLDINRLKPTDLKNIIVVDRFSISTVRLQSDPFRSGFLEPIEYGITLPNGFSSTVHKSRVVRFDGKMPLTVNGFQSYGNQWFGLSELTDILTTIENEDTLAKGIAHLTNEASIPVISMDNFSDAICSSDDDDEFDLDKRLEVQSIAKSIFRTTFIDGKDKFERVAVTFSGLPDLLDKFAVRLSAAADIPFTRFMGQSPSGLNTTGEGDMKNYAMSIRSEQENTLTPAYEMIDQITARMIGVDSLPDFDYPSLLSIDEKIQADTILGLSTAALNLATAGIIEVPEARELLRQNQLFTGLEDEDALEAITEMANK